MKKFFFIFCLSLISLKILAQSGLYIPTDIQMAYRNGTRSLNGKVTDKYWQNRADYKMSVEMNPKTAVIKGKQTITYSNNSHEMLKMLVFRINQDLYKKGSVHFRPIDPADLHDGVTIESLVINGTAIDIDNLQRENTLMKVRLPKGLESGGTAKIEIAWNFPFPKKTNLREGTYENESYFVAYFYPQIAVYDDINGWDMLAYNGEQEFYNEFGNFEVEITVPSSHLLWATGVWQNYEEILNSPFLERYKKALNSDKVVNIVEEKDLKKGKFTKGKSTNTWKFKAENVSDFAFALSPNYLWDGVAATVDKQKVFVDAAYSTLAEDFKDVAEIGKATVEMMSKDFPAIAFPYPKITVFNGSGGMEFPMMVNDGSFVEKEEVVYVTSHEIAHSYFPFYMGINERKYAFMDEGMTQMLPSKMQKKLVPTYKPEEQAARYYAYYAGSEMEFPLMFPSVMQHGMSYQISAYIRPQMAYYALEELLGEELFKTALKEYVNRWNGKHPIPYDFFFTFDQIAKEDLAWFWKPWFFEMGYPDLVISKASLENGKYKVLVEKKGNIPVPILLTFTFEDGTSETHKENARIWKDGKKEFLVEKTFTKKVIAINLGSPALPDVDLTNNEFKF